MSLKRTGMCQLQMLLLLLLLLTGGGCVVAPTCQAAVMCAQNTGVLSYFYSWQCCILQQLAQCTVLNVAMTIRLASCC